MRAVIIANGFHPSSKLVRSYIRDADLIICADGGANFARKAGIVPDIIIGDLDSITKETKRYFKSVPHLLVKDQNSTDLEKAISYCITHHLDAVDVIGALGERIDHTTGSLGCFKKYGQKVTLRFIDNHGELSSVGKHTTIETKKNEILSLIPLGKCLGVTTKNLKYSLKNASMELGVQEGISNVAVSSSVSISVRRGILLLFRFHR